MKDIKKNNQLRSSNRKRNFSYCNRKHEELTQWVRTGVWNKAPFRDT